LYLDQHGVTLGPEVLVKANINGRTVTVEGRVEGNVTGDEQVVLRRSSWVKGDIRAPRVVLEDGAHFRGGVHMGEDAAPAHRRSEPAAAKAATPEPSRPASAPQPAPAQPPMAPAAHATSGAPRTGTAKTAEVKG
jgi:cytoskeletal protein CcmA (bactofilin family)